ncbi:MAG TPA: alpha/beta hydrolase [Ferruginibacter sp.]|nr:alpha/beta hydrolase [Ferruginibacter sp.]
MSVQTKSIQFRGTNIVYKVQGYGVPVLLLHGFGEDSGIWDRQLPILESTCHLIIPDLPGSGSSGLLAGEVGIEDYAECIREVLREESIQSCSMIGHSMGGYITLAFVEKYPELLTSWGLFHSTAYADSDDKKNARRKSIDFILQHGSGAFLDTAIPGLFYDQAKNHEDINRLISRGSTGFKPEALVQYYEAMIRRQDRTNILREASVPVLWILGQHDQAVPFAQGLQQSYLAPQSEVHILRETAHMGMLEQTGLTNEILAIFLHNKLMINK